MDYLSVRRSGIPARTRRYAQQWRYLRARSGAALPLPQMRCLRVQVDPGHSPPLSRRSTDYARQVICVVRHCPYTSRPSFQKPITSRRSHRLAGCRRKVRRTSERSFLCTSDRQQR